MVGTAGGERGKEGSRGSWAAGLGDVADWVEGEAPPRHQLCARVLLGVLLG